jgi:4-alpha-glucanotransferase
MKTAFRSSASRGKAALRRLAASNGVQTSYRDIGGRTRYADDDTLAAVLGALGQPIGSSGSRCADTESGRVFGSALVEPVIVDRPRARSGAIVSLPPNFDPGTADLLLRLEDGTERSPRLLSRIAVPNRSEDFYRVELCTTGVRLPPGYHTLEVRAGGCSAQALVITPPSRLSEPDRTWGTFVPLHALRSADRDWGIGTFEHLRELCEWTRSLGGRFVGTLPVFAEFIDDDGDYAGPYLPNSRLVWNGAHIDVETLPELAADDVWAEEARERISSAAFVEEISRAGAARYSDLAAVWRLKRPILEMLARSAERGGSPSRTGLEEFVRSRPEVLAYARFRSAQERFGASWRTWPSRAWELSGAGDDDISVRLHLYVQWAAERQLSLARSAGGFYLDVPVGVHPNGFDACSEADSFVPGLSGGAPPDPFFAGGQSWGFNPLHPEGIRENRYRYVIDYLRNAMTHSSMVRIDHVMGLHRMWCVPDGFEPSRGAYIRYRADELHAIVALEASRTGTVVVGEDLGTVPSQVHKAMTRDGILSSFVLQFESSPDDPLPSAGRAMLASLGTHDLPTFRSYWNGSDILGSPGMLQKDPQGDAEAEKNRSKWREAVIAALALSEDDSTTEEEVVRAVLLELLEYLGAGAAAALMVDLEDLILETVRQNTPGTDISEGNFSRRSNATLEEISRDPYVVGCLTALARARGDVYESSDRTIERSRE